MAHRHPENEEVICANPILGRKANDVAKRYLAACPHYKMVPKDPLENAVWRSKIALACVNSPAARERVRQLCAEDFIFFARTFCWIIEPRIGEDVHGRVPFIDWRHQTPVMAAMCTEFGRRHMVGRKSRAQGASWLALMNLVWAFLFKNDSHLGIGSKTQEDSDDPKRPGSAGFKIDFLLKCLPPWLQPEGILLGGPNRSISTHTWVNVHNGSFIKAEAATSEIGRGSRFTQFVLDEAAFFPGNSAEAAVHNLIETTNSLMMVSTANGVSGAGAEFYRRVTNPGPWLTTNLMWYDNPVQSRGLYSTNPKTQAPLIHDRSYDYGDNYHFICDGKKFRSPWYDARERAHGFNALLLARELDCDFVGSVGRPFGEDLLARCKAFVKPATRRGHFAFDPSDLVHSGEFLVAPQGPLKLWRPLDGRGRLPPGEYFVGADIAAGTGGDYSSNSTICVLDASGDQVAEFASHKVGPADFADLMVAFCYWLSYGSSLPFLTWERNGTAGTQATARIVANGYPNVYRAASGEELRPYVKKGDKVGYHNSRTDYALTPLLNALTSGVITLRSEDLVRECGEYQYDAGGSGKWVHPGSKGTIDASAAGYNHGDRVIAAAMCVHGMKDRGLLTRNFDHINYNPEKNPPPNSMAARMREAERRKRERDGARSCIW